MKHIHMLPFLLQLHWESGWSLRNTKRHCVESPSTVGTHRQYPGGQGYMVMESPGLELSAVAHKPAYKKKVYTETRGSADGCNTHIK